MHVCRPHHSVENRHVATSNYFHLSSKCTQHTGAGFYSRLAVERYAIPVLPWPAQNHIAAISFLRNATTVCLRYNMDHKCMQMRYQYAPETFVGRALPRPAGGAHTALQTPKLELGEGPRHRDTNERRERKVWKRKEGKAEG